MDENTIAETTEVERLDWTRDELNITAYALGIPTGNAQALLNELDTKERERVVEACKTGGDEAIRLVRSIAMDLRQRQAKPKVEKGPQVEALKAEPAQVEAPQAKPSKKSGG